MIAAMTTMAMMAPVDMLFLPVAGCRSRLPAVNRQPNDRPTFDLQSHSTCSDGSLAPAAVVAHAAATGVEVMALTDHDTIDGVAEAAAAAREHGLRFSCASELSAVHRPDADVHIVGYELRRTIRGCATR